MRNRFISLLLSGIFLLFLSACTPRFSPVVSPQSAEATAFKHPRWSHSTNIYEVNVRQFSEEGTFAAFEKSLPRLKDMGIEVLWFMPITPIGVIDRKNSESDLGSYYAVRNYKEVNPEFGTMDDFKNLVRKAHSMGFKVITDWVPNHTAPDNPWITNHPSFYQHDDDGNITSPFDWTDTRQLAYSNHEMRDSMIAAMEFWLKETNIDGFRCDVAHLVPTDFWKDCIARLKKIKDVFMLAEGETPELHYAGFDATYTWSLMRPMEDIYNQTQPVSYLDSIISQNIKVFPENAMRLFFTTNHDENSWNGTEFEKYGDAYKAFAVFTQTMYQSIPLIYNGQEIPNKQRLQFFVKDAIQWTGNEMEPFYSTLLDLRKRNKALDADAAFYKVSTGNDDAIYAYLRQKGNSRILVILNLSPQPQQFTIEDEHISGKAGNLFTGESAVFNEDYVFDLQPWDYRVYEY